MSIEAYIRLQFEQLPPGEPLMLSRERWDWILAIHGVNGGAPPTKVSSGTEPRRAVYGVAALAEEFGIPESSMRRLLSRGLCGNPCDLKPSGDRKAYLIPAHIVSAIREVVASGHPIGTVCIVNLTPPWPGGCPWKASTDQTSVGKPDATLELRPGEQIPLTATGPVVTETLPRPEPQARGETPPPAHRRRTAARETKEGKTDLGAWRKIAPKREAASPS